MNKSKVTLEFSVTEGNRVRGWGEDAIQEYILRHPKLVGDVRFRCKRKEVDQVLEEISVSAEKETFGLDANVTLVDVGNEMARSSTGIPLSEQEQKELSQMIDTKSSTSQQVSPFKIKMS